MTTRGSGVMTEMTDEEKEALARYQRELDRWAEWLRNEEAYQQRLRSQLDPFNWGHWNER
jgi:hypothetical protein